jgi:hypothetical protein
MGSYRLFPTFLAFADIERLYTKGTKSEGDLLNDGTITRNGYIWPFRDVFLTHHLVHSIVPFFAFINAAPPFFIEKVIDFFRCLDGREYYCLIAEFLLRADRALLTYSLYYRFFTLFTETSATDLLKTILFSFEIWTSCAEGMQVKRILGHWNNVLFPGFTQQFLQFTTFRQVLADICFYFSSPLRPIATDLPTVSIRVSLNNLLSKFASVQFCDADTLALISHILTTTDSEQRLSLLHLLMDVADHIPNWSHHVQDLHTLFAVNDVALFSVTFQACLRLVEREDVSRQVELVSVHISPFHYQEVVLEELVSLSAIYPEVISIAALVAINLPSPAHVKVAGAFCRLVDSHKGGWISRLNSWYIWLLVLFLILDGATQETLLPAICEVLVLRRQDIDDVFGFLDLMSVRTQISVALYQLKILEFLCLRSEKSPSDSNLNVYRCSRYLLFQFCTRFHSDALLEAFRSSPFSARAPALSAEGDLKVRCLEDLSDLFDTQPCPLVFGINYSERSLPTFLSVVDSLISDPSTEDMLDITSAVYLDFFRYIATRERLPPRQRCETIAGLTQRIQPNVRVMNISFTRFWSAFLADSARGLQLTMKQAHTLGSVLREETNSIAAQAVEAARRACIARFQSADAMLETVRAEAMSPSSIWAGCRCSPRGLVRSARLLPDFSCSLLEGTRRPPNPDPQPTNEKPILAASGTLLRLDGDLSVQLSIFYGRLVIAGNGLRIDIGHGELWFVLLRDPNACEFVTLDGRAFLVEFTTEKRTNVARVYKQLRADDLPFVQSSQSSIPQFGFTADWVAGNLTNTEYLLRVNFIAGRSFNSLALYPIFPLIYLSHTCSRDLSYALTISPGRWLEAFSHFPTQISGRTVSGLLAENTFELTPEFFTMPEALSGIPEPYEFVYRIRRLLESESVSRTLNLWIDAVFGVHGCFPVKIFRTPHPQRAATRCQRQSLVHFEVARAPSYVSIEAVDGTIISVYSIAGTVLRKTIVDLAKPRTPDTVFSRQISVGKAAIASIAGGLLLINSERCEFEFIRPDQSLEFQQEVLPVDVCEDNGLCYAFDGAVFCIEKVGSQFESFGVCKVSPEVPTCAFSEQKYGLTLVGVRGGRILVFDRRSGEYLRAIGEEGSPPNRVLLTATFPFVVAQYKGELRLLSVYGEALRKADIAFEIGAWCPFVSLDGFDFVFLADTLGGVFVMEAFVLNPVEIARCRSRVLTMRFSNELRGVVAVTAEGRGFFIPEKLP